LLKGFLGERSGLSHHPPALPFFITISHKMFAPRIDYIVNLSGNIYLMIYNFAFQFYATFVPFIFSLFFILSVYFLGKIFFSHRIGLASAWFLSLTPIELVVANKIWADDMTAFFAVVAVIFYFRAQRCDKPIFALLSGLICGLSILTKMSGLYMIIVILVFHALEHQNSKVNPSNLIKFLFDKNIFLFLAGVLIMSGWWIQLFYLGGGFKGSVSYVFKVNETSSAVRAWNQYFQASSSRPWFSYFVLVPFQFPLYFLSYCLILIFFLKKHFKAFGDLFLENVSHIKFLIVWVIVVFIFLSLKPGKELRYMLIAYPAISILSAYCLDVLYKKISSKVSGVNVKRQGLLFALIICVSILYALIIALPRVLLRSDLIPFPF
ncbi:glycosyltransferase family 39 protein, partial [Thermoproteota archaeon]